MLIFDWQKSFVQGLRNCKNGLELNFFVLISVLLFTNLSFLRRQIQHKVTPLTTLLVYVVDEARLICHSDHLSGETTRKPQLNYRQQQ